MYVRTFVWLVLVCISVNSLSSCASSKAIAPSGLTPEETEKALAKKNKKEAKAQDKINKQIKKDYWNRQSKEVKKRVKEAEKKNKKNKRKQGRFIA